MARPQQTHCINKIYNHDITVAKNKQTKKEMSFVTNIEMRLRPME